MGSKQNQNGSQRTGAYGSLDIKKMNKNLAKISSRNFIFDNNKTREQSFKKLIPIAFSAQSEWSKSLRLNNLSVCKKSKKLEEFSSDIPGPGTYDADNYKFGKKGPYLTLKPKIDRSDYHKEIPGPGAYYDSSLTLGRNIQSSLSANQSVKSLKNQHKIDLAKYLNHKPLPNAMTYSPNIEAIKSNSKKWVIGSSAKSEFLKEVEFRKFEPSPDSYTISPKEHGPYFSLKGKFERKDENGIPGPGKYSIKTGFIKLNRTKHGLGLGGRYSYITHNPKIPGPGSYEVSTSSLSVLKPDETYPYTSTISIL